ncbi:MAG: hypothetical protein N2745_05130 [Syntrophorhabdaceae bacterium]|nr:hypothetical protein [Syntrophorhabdaceae bacterium]
MRRLGLDKLKPGMKLAKPVLNENNVVLLNSDTVLTEEKISKLFAMKIDSVCIKEKPGMDKPKEEMIKSIELRFERLKDEPIMDVIKRALLKHVEDLYGETGSKDNSF